MFSMLVFLVNNNRWWSLSDVGEVLEKSLNFCQNLRYEPFEFSQKASTLSLFQVPYSTAKLEPQ
jgi:hypothetical protein